MSIEAENIENNRVLDSILTRNRFEDYRSLQVEVDTLIYTLKRIGYIDSEITSFEKVTDSTYLVHFDLGKPFKKIKIYYLKKDFNTPELINISSEVSDDYFEIPFYQLEEVLNYLTQLKSGKGSAFVNIRLEALLLRSQPRHPYRVRVCR